VVDLETGYSFEVEINDAGNSDMLVATGDVTIAAGASLVIQPESLGEDCSTNDWIMTYQLIAPNSVTGVFDAVTESFTFMDVLTIYERKAVFLA